MRPTSNNLMSQDWIFTRKRIQNGFTPFLNFARPNSDSDKLKTII